MASVAGIIAFVGNRAPAVQGVVTVTGTAYFQDKKPNGDGVVKTHSVNQSTILQLLAEATGDGSITNKPTRLYYDPDQFNDWWYDSDPGWYDPYSYGVFYYSNSVAGLTALQGYDYYGGPYWSYMELNSYVATGWYLGSSRLGISGVADTDYNQMLKESKNSVAATGNAVLYIHSNPYLWGLPSHHHYANLSSGYYQRAMVIQGVINFNSSCNGNICKDSFNLQGSGDGVWYDAETGWIPLVIKGTAKFSGTEPD